MNDAGIDSRVVNVNGYVVSQQQLYGIDASRRAFVVSEDDGLTWYSVSGQRFTWAASQGPDYVSAVTVPWIQGAGLTSAAPVPPYVVASWGGRPVHAVFTHPNKTARRPPPPHIHACMLI